jgi:hypothetical protein
VAAELLGFCSGDLPLHLTVTLSLNSMAKLTLPRHLSYCSCLPVSNGPFLSKSDLTCLHIIKAGYKKDYKSWLLFIDFFQVMCKAV